MSNISGQNFKPHPTGSEFPALKSVHLMLILRIRSGLLVYSNDAPIVFPHSQLDAVSRCFDREPLVDTAIFNDKREITVHLQPSITTFKSAFDRLTANLLAGLNWTNVLVAGGIVLTTLLLIDYEAKGVDHTNSDIDIYIYGLGPVEAIEKLEHIQLIFKSNLCKGASYRILRNSKTVT